MYYLKVFITVDNNIIFVVFSTETDIVRLQMIACDSGNGANLVIQSATRLAQLLGADIDVDQLMSIHRAIWNANVELLAAASRKSHSTAQLFANRMQLIDSITIDEQTCGDARWLHEFASLLHDCFIDGANGGIDDVTINQLVYRIIIEKLRLLLSDRVWSRMSWMTTSADNVQLSIDTITSHRIGIICAFGALLHAYRIEMCADDFQLYTRRLATLVAIRPHDDDLQKCIETVVADELVLLPELRWY
jgi:hypothetical protein